VWYECLEIKTSSSEVFRSFSREHGCQGHPSWLALVDDFRTTNRVETVAYPELVYQKVRST
jgi:hypothetical protein